LQPPKPKNFFKKLAKILEARGKTAIAMILSLTDRERRSAV